MDKEKLKQTIKVNLENAISTIDPGFNLEESIDTYIRVLSYSLKFPTPDDLNSLESIKINTLTEVLVEGKINEASITNIGLFNQKFESYVKKLYYILEEFGHIREETRVDPSKPSAFGPFLTALNKSNPYYIGKDGQPTLIKSDAEKDGYGEPVLKRRNGSIDLQYERLYPSSLKLDKYSDPKDSELSKEYSDTFIYHFYRSYILRNRESHQSPALNQFEALPNLQSTLITELWFANYLKHKINSGLLESSSKVMDFTEYIDLQIDLLKESSSKFVPLSLRIYSAQNTENKTTTIQDLKESENLRIRILGEGGSGKTTTLEYLVYDFCKRWKENKSSKLPVLLTLAGIKERESIRQAIARKILIEPNVVDELIETNSLILFLDGMNEIVKSREEKKKRIKEISVLLEENTELEIIITDRYDFDTYQSNPFSIPTYGIQKLSEEQIEEFVKSYTKNTDFSPELILDVIESKPEIKELLTKPLLLSRAIEIVKIDNDLPNREGAIIEKFIDLMLKREKDEKMDPLLKIKEFKLLLAYVADSIFNEYTTNLPISEDKFRKLATLGAGALGLESHNAGYTLRMGFELEILTKKDDLLRFYHDSFFKFFVAHYADYELL